MEARAINRYIGSSPRKMRLVVDLVRGKSVEEALTILHFSPKHAAKVAEKVVRSAVSNLQNKQEGGRVDTHDLYIKEVYVDGGPSLKRVSPAPMGRAYRVLKRSNHLTVVVAARESRQASESRRAEKPVSTKSKPAVQTETSSDKEKTRKQKQ
jgi:large subunit ribosomal protein L22